MENCNGARVASEAEGMLTQRHHWSMWSGESEITSQVPFKLRSKPRVASLPETQDGLPVVL